MRKLALLLLIVLVAVSPLRGESPESTTQMKLAVEPTFLARLQYVMVQQARTVKAEALDTACHAERTAFADRVIDFPPEMAAKSAVMLVGGVNLIGTVTVTPASGDTPESVTTSVTDAALLSQVATFWNALSKCDTGS